MNPFEQLISALAGVPVLHGARCRAKHHLFDADPVDTADARHAQAVRLCQSCPALEPCGRWLESLTPARRPTGIVAGRLIEPRERRKPAEGRGVG